MQTCSIGNAVLCQTVSAIERNPDLFQGNAWYTLYAGRDRDKTIFTALIINTKTARSGKWYDIHTPIFFFFTLPGFHHSHD